MLNEIINKLGDNYINSDINSDINVIKDTIDNYSNIALDISNKSDTAGLEPYIIEAVISDYLRRGNEGMTGSNEGSISSSYIDIQEKLRKDIISNGKRKIL